MNIIIDNSPLPNVWIKDYRGQKFHRLTIVAYERRRSCGGAVWRCVCECGNITTATIHDLKSKHTTSCGCASADRLRKMRTTHGKSKTVEYKIWKGIYTRCYNPRSKIYKYYGGKGVIVCDRWLNSFENFLSDMGLRPSQKHSVDRKDTNGPYSPENCHWVTKDIQANNTTANRYIEYNGETHTVADWCRILNLPYNRIRARILRGASPEKAFK